MALACTGCWSARQASPTPFPPGLVRGPQHAASDAATTGEPTNAAQVLQEVQELGKTDPAAQQALLADLQKSDPSMWPQVLQAFRSSMAYREQYQQRMAAAGGSSVANHSPPTAGQSAYQQASYHDPGITGTSEVPSYYPNTDAMFAGPSPNSAVPLPKFDEGPIGPATPPPELAAGYPQTNLPPIRVASNDDLTGKLTPEYVPPTTERASDWREHLSSAIRLLDEEIASSDESSAAIAQKRQRLLQLIAGNDQESTKPISGLSPKEQQFWSAELLGLARMLDDQTDTTADRRFAEAIVHLRSAAESLGKSANLEVRNLAFCTEVTSFGVYKPFTKYEFKPGEETLLYAELEHFESTPTERGFHTSLRSSYEIFDARGARVDEHDFAITEEFCRNPRRDFFIRYFVYMPKQIEPGTYTLQLTIEDLKSEKVGRGQIQFTIGE